MSTWPHGHGFRGADMFDRANELAYGANLLEPPPGEAGVQVSVSLVQR
jgi:hypothetical protein